MDAFSDTKKQHMMEENECSKGRNANGTVRAFGDLSFFRRVGSTVVSAARAMLLRWGRACACSSSRNVRGKRFGLHWASVPLLPLIEPDVTGHLVTLNILRHFQWPSQSDDHPRWETRTYNLARLVAVDLVLSHRTELQIARTLVSFEFSDGQRVVFSLEFFQDQGDPASALGALFCRYRRVLVVADERDVIRPRSNVRGDGVYLHPLNLGPAEMRTLFLVYSERATELECENCAVARMSTAGRSDEM